MTKYLETKTNSIEEAIKRVVLEKKLDPVNPKAVKKKFDDRKDKDIDNDGDVDSTDKYLHKRRKAISKAVKNERVTDVGVDQAKRDLKHAKIQKKISDVKKEETELDEAKFQVNYSKGGKLFSKTINAKDEDDAEEKAIKQFKIDDDDIRSVVKESLDEGYESEVMKVLNKADIDGYFKMGKLHVNKRDAKDAKKALEDSDEITKLPKMVMEDNKMMKLTKRQRQALSSPAAKGKGKSSVTLPGAEFLSKKKQPTKVGRQSQVVKYEEVEMIINEKTEYVEYEFKNRGDAMKAKKYFDGIQLMDFEVNDDNIGRGQLMVDAGNRDMTRYHKEVMKKFSPKVMKTEAYEIGNDYAKHTLRVTPGQTDDDVDEMIGVMQKKSTSMRETLAKMWGMNEGKNPFEKKDLTKETKDGKTMTGQKPTTVKVNPKIEEK